MGKSNKSIESVNDLISYVELTKMRQDAIEQFTDSLSPEVDFINENARIEECKMYEGLKEDLTQAGVPFFDFTKRAVVGDRRGAPDIMLRDKHGDKHGIEVTSRHYYKPDKQFGKVFDFHYLYADRCKNTKRKKFIAECLFRKQGNRSRYGKQDTSLAILNDRVPYYYGQVKEVHNDLKRLHRSKAPTFKNVFVYTVDGLYVLNKEIEKIPAAESNLNYDGYEKIIDYYSQKHDLFKNIKKGRVAYHQEDEQSMGR